MLKKILIVLGAVLLVAVGAVATFLILNSAHKKETAQLTTQIADYQQRIEAIGPIVTCYTVKQTVEPGTQLTAEMLVEQNIPQSFTNEDFALSLDEIVGTPVDEEGREQVGYFAKTYIEPGTPITKSLLMIEDLPDSARELDITGNRWPIGLKVGDYVDIRITYSMGEDFIVLPHKRVYEINNQTLKVHMTEEEMHIYQAALVDWYISQDMGTDLYFTKYIEPGVQSPATPYYTVPKNIEAVCLADPNIVNQSMVAFKENLYNLQVAARDQNIPTDDRPDRWESYGGMIASGRQTLNGLVSADFAEWYQEYLQMKEEEAQANAAGEGEGESLVEQGGVG